MALSALFWPFLQIRMRLICNHQTVSLGTWVNKSRGEGRASWQPRPSPRDYRPLRTRLPVGPSLLAPHGAGAGHLGRVLAVGADRPDVRGVVDVSPSVPVSEGYLRAVRREDGVVRVEVGAGREDGPPVRAVRLDGLDAPPGVEHQLAPVGRPVRAPRFRPG